MRNAEFVNTLTQEFDKGMVETVPLPADEEWDDLNEVRRDFDRFLTELEKGDELPCELTFAIGVDEVEK